MSKIKSLEAKLDTMWSAIITSAGNCAKCGGTYNLDPHHIKRRASKSTRWDLNNGICLCSKCHTESSDFSAHGTIKKFEDWICERNGELWYYELTLKSNKTVKYYENDLEEMLAELTKVFIGI